MISALRTVAFAGVLALGGACTTQQADIVPDVARVEMKMREMRFDFSPAIPRGRVAFQVINRGRVEHRLLLIPLPEDFPPIQQQISGTERRPVNPLAGTPDALPGEEDSFLVDLTPGRYGLVCLVLEPDGKTHADLGMTSEFRVA